MKLNDSFIKYEMDGQALLVPVYGARFHGLIQGNKSVEVILECLLSDTTEEEIVSVMRSRFKGDEAVIREDVKDVIEKLKAIGAIDE